MAEPSDADALTHGEAARFGAERVDMADHLVSRDGGGSVRRQVTFDEVQVGAAHTARRHAHEYLTAARRRLRQLHVPQRSALDRARAVDDPGAHVVSGA